MTGLEWLTSFQWSMGNGQCPVCQGMGPTFATWVDAGMAQERDLGHVLNCPVADAMVSLGEAPQYKEA